MSRPSSYRPEFARQAAKLCRLGATDQEIADFFEIDVRTVGLWKEQHDDFLQALKTGKSEADERVERSLYAAALGYEHDAVKIMHHKGAPVIVPYREKVAPSVTACIFWLKNRRPDLWRDRHEHAISVDAASVGDEALEAIVRAGGGAAPTTADDPPITH